MMKPLEQVKQEAKKCFDENDTYQNMEPTWKKLSWTHFWVGWLQTVYENEYESLSSNNPS